jgi:hypothetical protein
MDHPRACTVLGSSSTLDASNRACLLSAALTGSVGREHEAVEVDGPIAAHRLVTLAAASGVGKTRAVAEHSERF